MSDYNEQPWRGGYEHRGRSRARNDAPVHPTSQSLQRRHDAWGDEVPLSGRRYQSYSRTRHQGHVPDDRIRPQSLSPPRALVPRPWSYHARSSSRSPSPNAHRDEQYRNRGRRLSPPRRLNEQARSAVDNPFSRSSSGIGVGLLGAVMGGLAARELSSAALRTRSKKELNEAVNGVGTGPYAGPHDGPVYNHPHPRARRPSEGRTEAQKTRMVSTVVGAIVGGLGANAIESRFESSRQRHRAEQKAWERKWGQDGLGHEDRDWAAKPGRAAGDRYVRGSDYR